MARSTRPPWKRSNPRKRAGKASTHLTPKEEAAAKARAKRAGRRYPNLVDNMRMASKTAKKKTRKTAKKKVGKKRAAHKRKTTGKKSTKKAREKDPKGGLIAADRRASAKED